MEALEQTFYDLLKKIPIINIMINNVGLGEDLVVFGGAVREFLATKGKIESIDTYIHPDEEGVLHLHDIDIFTSDMNLIHKLTDLKDIRIQTKGYKGEIDPVVYVWKLHYKEIHIDLCCYNNISSLTTDVDVNSLYFDFKHKQFHYINGTEEQLINTIENIKNKQMTLLQTPETLKNSRFLSKSFHLYRLAKMWKLGYRPKDRQQFIEMYRFLNPDGNTKYSYPSTQFVWPIVDTSKEMKEFCGNS